MNEALLPVYRRADIMMVRGEGAYLFDEAGRRYLDFATGIGVSALGHSHPHLVAALKTQADLLWHCSNLYRNPGLERLAQRLADATFADKVFFCSSGTEAVECAIKMIRKYHHARGQGERFRIITFQGGFHGRTFGGISAGGNDLAREGFGPLLDGFDRVPFGDLAAVRRAVTSQTGGIMLEAVLGEGGVRVAPPEFLRELRAFADEHGLLLFCDEVQCGMGRTGRLFAFEHAGIAPDIVTIAKAIGGGFPLAACLATGRAASGMVPGSHGSTYGGNPLAMAVGNAVLDVILDDSFLFNINKISSYFKPKLEDLARRFPALIAEIRGMGLMLGLRMKVPHRDFAARLRDLHGLLTAPASEDGVIRLLPPLIINESHADEALAALDATCSEWK